MDLHTIALCLIEIPANFVREAAPSLEKSLSVSMPATLPCQKHLFDLPPDQHYVNCAYMSPLSKQVVAAGHAGIQRKVNPTTIAAADFFTEVSTARERIAQLIQAPSDDSIALIPAASYGIATVANNTQFEAHQNIVVLHEQFPSNIYSWHRVQERTGVTIRTIQPPPFAPDRGHAWNERVLAAIDADTALVAMPHVHWADGTLFDLAAIGARAREVEAVFVVDGTQSVGALPLDVSTVQPDALICAGYKWLLGPYSSGFAYYGSRLLNGIPLEENWITRRNSEDFSGLVQYESAYQPGATRYDVGERSNFILVPMLLAGVEHLLDWGVANIQTYCANLTVELLNEAQSWGFQVPDADTRASHLFGIRVPDSIPLTRLRESLAQHRVSVSLRGNAVRISPHVYNDATDIAALRAALNACL